MKVPASSALGLFVSPGHAVWRLGHPYLAVINSRNAGIPRSDSKSGSEWNGDGSGISDTMGVPARTAR